ncbi:hypothetical protein ES703_32424 [subsurface metagenome]
MNLFHHERIYRGKDTLAKIRNFPIVIGGAGAIGSNLTENLVRQGFGNLTVIDKDRIEDRNINTQVWTKREIGMLKAYSIRNRIFEIAGIEINSVARVLEKRNITKFISPDSFIIDAFDNSQSRQLLKDLCLKAGIDCLHIGFSGNYGEIIWNQDYRVPDDKGEDDCDYPLARNLIMLLTGVASEVIVRFVVSGEKKSYTITLEDFKIEEYHR